MNEVAIFGVKPNGGGKWGDVDNPIVGYTFMGQKFLPELKHIKGGFRIATGFVYTINSKFQVVRH
jgi:hypothetical protein